MRNRDNLISYGNCWKPQSFQQIIILERKLESERATGRDLSAQAVKLRGMLKTGQDALLMEQQLVGQLKEQLKHFHVRLP